MRRSRKPIVIAARASELAKVQAQMVGRGLSRVHPELRIEYHWVQSRGDQIADAPLADYGGKGLFTSAVEAAVLKEEADVAVHSLKDMPCDRLTPGLAVAAVPKRADARDCLIGPDGPIAVDDLPDGATIGTASPRRGAQLLRLRPDLRLTLIRGNVPTRLAKVADPDSGYDATLLAAAGLRRLKLKDLIAAPLTMEQMLSAAGQGALCVQCRADDHITLTRCLPLNDPATSTAVHAERNLVAALGAGCHSPIAVYVHGIDPRETVAKRNADSHWVHLHARVLSANGSECLETQHKVKTPELGRLVKAVAQDLLDSDAGRLLREAELPPHHNQPTEPLPTEASASNRSMAL